MDCTRTDSNKMSKAMHFLRSRYHPPSYTVPYLQTMMDAPQFTIKRWRGVGLDYKFRSVAPKLGSTIGHQVFIDLDHHHCFWHTSQCDWHNHYNNVRQRHRVPVQASL